MSRNIVAVVVGIVAFAIVAGICDWLLRLTWPDYATAEPVFGFTLAMQLARLVMGAVATIVAGAVTGAIARRRAAVIATGIVLVVLFVPVHAMIWDKFPIWYHLAFLTSLVPVTMLAGARRRA